MNGEIYDAARELLVQIPGRPSISGLVDEMLERFVAQFGRVAVELVNADDATRARLMRRFHGDASVELSLEFAEMIRTLEQKGEIT